MKFDAARPLRTLAQFQNAEMRSGLVLSLAVSIAIIAWHPCRSVHIAQWACTSQQSSTPRSASSS